MFMQNFKKTIQTIAAFRIIIRTRNICEPCETVSVDEMLCYTVHSSSVIYTDMVKVRYIIIEADSRDTCCFDAFKYLIHDILMSKSVSQEDSAVEVVEIRQVEDIEFTFFVIWIDRTAE